MQDSPSHCCRAKHASPSGENRRGFLSQAMALLCGGAALLVPAAVGVCWRF